MSDGFAERLAAVQARVQAACERAGRAPDSVRLVAVSKTMPAARIREGYDAGLRVFGESYAQELRDKSSELEELPGIEWHFIGPVQTNKARYLVGRAALVHAVDRLEAAEALSRRAERTQAVPVRCLLAVRLGGEATKHGVEPGELPGLLSAVRALPAIRVEGLMCLPPWDDDPEATRPHFRRLRALRDELASTSGTSGLFHLSMGMSHDLEVAVEEGATLVRVGTALFGPRARRA